MEETEELRWALKVIIKRQMQHLMDQLRQTGEEVAVLSVNLEENTYSHFGSPAGEGFIAEQKNLTKNFLAFCKKKPDDLPEIPASEPEAPFKPPPAQVSKQPAKKAVKPVDKPIEAPAELELPSTSSSESGTGKVLMINIPRLLSKKNISDEKVAGMVGRIVAAKLMDKKLPQGDGDQSKFAELVEAAVQARTLRSGVKRSREASESPQEKRARMDSGEVSTPKITPPQDATRTRSGRKISSKYLESINSLRGGKPIKTEADADTVEHTEGTEVDKSVFTEEEQNLFLQQLSKVSGEALKKVTVRTGDKEVDLENTELDLEGLEHLFGPVLDEIEKSSIDDETEGTQEVQHVVVNVIPIQEASREGSSDECADDDRFSFENVADEDSVDVSCDTADLEKEIEEEEDAETKVVIKPMKRVKGASGPMVNLELIEPISAHEFVEEGGLVTSKSALKIFKGKVPGGGTPPSKLMQQINFTCDLCGLVLKGYTSLNNHKRTVHAKIKRRVCDVCGWRFSARSQLRSHKTAVHIRKCENCHEYVNEVGPWPEGVTRNTAREVLCANCNQVVLFQSGTARHNKTNTVVKDNPASPQKVYIHPDAITEESDPATTKPDVEQPSTSEEAPVYKERKFKPRLNHAKYVCQECGKLFEAPSEVKKHMIIHTKNRNYMCDLCGATLKSKLTLSMHIKLHDPNLGFTCPVCQKFYRNKDNFVRHLLTKHNISVKMSDIKIGQPLQVQMETMEAVPVVSEYDISLIHKDFSVIEEGPVTMTEHEVQVLTE